MSSNSKQESPSPSQDTAEFSRPKAWSRQFHPLFPRPTDHGEQSSSASSRGKVVLPRKRPAVPAACYPCRKRKSKCNAARPTCQRCQQLGTPCEYETDEAETYNELRKRRIVELESANSFKDELIDFLRTRSASDVVAVLQRLKAGEDVEAIVRHVRDGDLVLQCVMRPPEGPLQYEFPMVAKMPDFLLVSHNTYLGSLLWQRTMREAPEPPPLRIDTENSEKPYEVPYHAAELYEPRLEHVKASRWTQVTSSDGLVRKLLATYFQFDFPYDTFFHVDCFLDDLVSGKEQYCSPLLVNAILAVACHGQTGLPWRTEFWNPRSLGYQFLAEAKRLWEMEKGGKNKITTIQAGQVISLCLNMDGMDKVGLSYLLQSIAMAHDKGLFTKTFSSRSQKQRTVYAISSWSLFSWQAMQFFAFYKEPLFSQPPLIDVPHQVGELWIKYPGSNTPSPLNHSAVFRAITTFRSIMNQLALRLFGLGKAKGPLSFHEAMGFRKQLLDWLAALPTTLTSRHIVMPAHLKLHMHYHSLMFMLFSSLSDQPKTERKDAEGLTAPPLPQDIVAHSRISIETLIRLYYLRHSFESWDTFLLPYLQFVGFLSLKSIASAPDEETRMATSSTVALCAKGLRDQGCYNYITEAVFVVLRDTIGPRSTHLLKDVEDVGDEVRRKELAARQIQSGYPINIVSIVNDPEKRRLDKLVQGYSGFSLNDGTGSESERSSTGSPD